MVGELKVAVMDGYRWCVAICLLVSCVLVSCAEEGTSFPSFEEWRAAHPVAPFFRVLAETTSEVTDGSVTLTFDVREGMTSLEITAATPSDVWIQVTSIRGPDGERHVDTPEGSVEGYPFPESISSENVTFPRIGRAAFRYPNDAQTVLEPGRWSVTLSTYALERNGGVFERSLLPAPLHARVSGRVAEVNRGIFNLHIFLGPQSGFSEAMAGDDPGLTRSLEAVRGVFMQQGVVLGDVVFEDAPSLPETVHLEPRTCIYKAIADEIGQHVNVSQGYIPVVFVRRFSCRVLDGDREVDAGPLLYGMSPGVPGDYVTVGDAIVVSTSGFERTPTDWTQTLAHEIGHFLGLMHVIQGPFEDNLEDTANSEMNLMFPTVTTRAMRLTEQQGVVLRQSPYVQLL